jgi:hypothetical protein
MIVDVCEHVGFVSTNKETESEHSERELKVELDFYLGGRPASLSICESANLGRYRLSWWSM